MGVNLAAAVVRFLIGEVSRVRFLNQYIAGDGFLAIID